MNLGNIVTGGSLPLIFSLGLVSLTQGSSRLSSEEPGATIIQLAKGTSGGFSWNHSWNCGLSLLVLTCPYFCLAWLRVGDHGHDGWANPPVRPWLVGLPPVENSQSFRDFLCWGLNPQSCPTATLLRTQSLLVLNTFDQDQGLIQHHCAAGKFNSVNK